MKATEQYFPVVLFIILFKVALAFEPVRKILQFFHVAVLVFQRKLGMTFLSL